MTSPLLAFRIICFVYVSFWICYGIFFQKQNYHYFFFLTNWNWMLDWLYFLVAILMVKSPTTYLRVYQVFMAIIPTISTIVVVVFWCLLNTLVFGPNRPTEMRVSSTVSHTLNFILPIIDIYCTNDIILTWKHGIYPVIVMFFYTVLIFFTKLVLKEDFPYSFIKAVNGGSEDIIMWGPVLALCFGFYIITWIFWLLVFKSFQLRNFIKKRYSGTASVSEVAVLPK
ncbi:hypothetical protein BC833DRAFT_15746 [Globomyces pollinis-pini]|nr:hypothetical protein BC833DRAFT_15746 [Globomyces pollinis-pini]